MKEKLIFDVSDANTIADSDSVGAYLRSSDGTLLTHSDVGGRKALDVSVADGINVEVDLSHLDDSVRLGDGTDFFTSTSENGDVALDVHISNSSIEVTATDLDIRDLAFATDSVTAHQGGTWTIDSITNEVTVNDAALADTAILSGANTLTLAGTADKTIASNLSNRKYLFIYNNDNRTMYVGASGVTSSDGYPLSPGSAMQLRAGAAIDVYFNSDRTGHAIRTLELS